MVLTVQQTIVAPQLPYMWWSMSLFIDRVWIFLFTQRQVRTVLSVLCVEIPQAQFLVLLMTCPSLCNDTVLIDRVVDIADMLQRQVLTVPNCALGLVIDMPVIVHVKVVDIPVVTQRLFPTVQFILQTTVIPQLQSIDKVVDVPVCRFSSFSDAVCEKTVEIPQLQHVEARTLGGALCTGTRPGLTPAIGAGKGWRGRRESDSQVTRELDACVVRSYRQKHVLSATHVFEPPHTTHHTPYTTTPPHSTPLHSTSLLPPPPVRPPLSPLAGTFRVYLPNAESQTE